MIAAERIHCHFVVEGQAFLSAKHVFLVAKDRGFTGGFGAVRHRLRKGASTWAEITAPLTQAARITARQKTKAAKQEEMRALIAALDARKAAAHD